MLQQPSVFFNLPMLEGNVQCWCRPGRLTGWLTWGFHPSVFEVRGFFTVSPEGMVNCVVHQCWIVLLYWQPSGKTSQAYTKAIAVCLFFFFYHLMFTQRRAAPLAAEEYMIYFDKAKQNRTFLQIHKFQCTTFPSISEACWVNRHYSNECRHIYYVMQLLIKSILWHC